MPCSPNVRGVPTQYTRSTSIPTAKTVSSPSPLTPNTRAAVHRDLVFGDSLNDTAADRLATARAMEGSVRQETNVKAVMCVLKHQAELDLDVEEAKSALPCTISLEGLMNSLDRFRKGFVTDTELWRFTQDFGAATPFGSLCTLVHELQLRTPRDNSPIPGHLSMRSVGILIFPVQSKEFEIVVNARTDHDAMSELYLHRRAESCPGCGVRVQRDTDAASCPDVECPLCNTKFQCHVVESDGVVHWEEHAVPNSVQFHVHRLLDVAARAAEEFEKGRKKLASFSRRDVLRTLSDVFSFIAEGRLSFTMADLRRAFTDHDIFLSDKEFRLLWRRYQPLHFPDVGFSDFATQLRQRSAAAAPCS